MYLRVRIRLATMASDAAAVLDAAGVESAHLYGVSMGGMIAQEFALQYPKRVKSLILGCTAAGGPEAKRAAPEVIEVLTRQEMTPEEAACAINPYIYDKGTPPSRIEEDLKIRLQWVATFDGYMAQLQGIMMWEAYSRIGQIAAPTLVVHGETDQLVPAENGKLIAQRISGSKIVMIPNASHIYSTDQPDAAHKPVLEFLSAQNINSATTLNHKFELAARPVGLPKRSDWKYAEEPVREVRDGELQVKILYISLDPAMRGWINEGQSYVPPVGIGEVMRAGGLGRVVESKNPGFASGDYVTGLMGVQEYAISDGKGLNKIDPKMAPLPVYLGGLGMTGMTAYFGLLDVGQPKAGETVVISAAAGATGMIAGQIAKIKGCRAIGIAGGAAKCEFIVKELGFDAAIDYKAEDVRKAMQQHCPKGIDIYFDNVGGEILDAALSQLARGARVLICGAISQYNNTTPIKGPSNYLSLLVNRAMMEGFLVFDYASRYGEAAREMAGWYAAGKLKTREDIAEGFENFPEVFLKLFKGENTGKLMLKVADA